MRYRITSFLVLALLGLTPGACFGQDEIDWDGQGADNNWLTVDNWDHFITGALPTGSVSEIAVIANGDTALVNTDLANISSPDGPPGQLSVSGGSTLLVDGSGAFRTDSSGESVDGSAVFAGGTLALRGANARFFSDSLSFTGGGTYSPLLTSGSQGLVSVVGDVNFQGGSLSPQLDGYTPVGGETWTLIDAGSINNLNVAQTFAPPGQRFVGTVTNGGTNGQLLRLAIESVAVLTANVDDGSISIASPSGDPIEIIGYGLRSPLGRLNPAGWVSLEEQSIPGWNEAGTPSSNFLDELAGPINSTTQGSATLTGTPTGLGTPLQATTGFQQAATGTDLVFTYVTSDFELVEGQVTYTGLNLVNDLLLTVDPDSGQAELTNSSTTPLSLRGYSILSGSGSLKPANGDWDSLQDQGEVGVSEANANANHLSELVALSSNAVQLAPGEAYQLGDLFTTTGNQDLTLEFVIEQTATTGDYNGDGEVNLADYAVWRDNLGASGDTLANRDPANSGPVSAADYTSWKQNFGMGGSGGGALAIYDGTVQYASLAASVSAASVPEPATLVLAVLLGAAIAMRPRPRTDRLEA